MNNSGRTTSAAPAAAASATDCTPRARVAARSSRTGGRWIGSRLRDDELDAGLLMWDVRRFVRIAEFPPRPVVIHFSFRDARPGEHEWWLLVEQGVADLCRDDPGREPTLVVDATVRALTDVWSGEHSPQQVLQSGELRVLGAPVDAQQLWCWLGTSAFAITRRQALQAARHPPD